MCKRNLVVVAFLIAVVGGAVSSLAGTCYVGQSQGCVSWTGDYEVFKLGLRGGVSYSISLSVPFTADLDMKLLDSSGNVIAASTWGGHGESEMINFTPLFGGTYYLVVYSYSGSGCFTVRLTKRC